jgi:haloalkane dehalogenase
MRYLEFEGAGIPLLMVHGLGCASSFEYPHVATAPALRGRHVILLDLLGFGFSDHPEDFGYRVQDHALQIRGFVEERGLDRIDLYGHSMGGSIAIEAADLIGEKIGQLILSEANLDSGGGTFSRPIAASTEADYLAEGHRKACDEARAAGDDGWAATMRAASALAVYRGARSLVEGSFPDWRSRFLRHPARKAYIFGEHSLPDPDAEFLPSRGIRVLVVPAAGHSMSLENPHGLAAAIAEASSEPAWP